MSLKIAVVEFTRGYHVGWDEPRLLIDHVTILRAIMYASYITGSYELAEKIVGGCLGSTSMLPVIPTAKGLRLLSPFPRIPSLVKYARLSRLWSTVNAVVELLNYASKCLSGKSLPAVKDIERDELVVYCPETELGGLNLNIVGDIVCYGQEDCSGIPAYYRVSFDTTVEYRNRIDRVTGSADVYAVSYVSPSTPLWVGFRDSCGVSEHALSMLELLGRIGLGGLKSRDLGRFNILKDTTVYSLDLNLLNKYSGWKVGYNYLLASILPGEWMDNKVSWAQKTTIVGYSGDPTGEYRLPVIEAMDVGGVVYARKEPKHISIPVGGGRAQIVFNPVVVHGVG